MMKKNSIYIFKFAILLLVLNLSKVMAQTRNNADFSGNWIINYDKSDFGQIPHYVISKQLQAVQTPGIIAIQLLMQTPSGSDSTVNETLPVNGKAVVSVGGDQRKRTITAQISADGKTLTIITIASVPNDPDTQQYLMNETWSIAGDMLNIKKTVTADGAVQYSVNAVYSKK
jgi:hypothetical protein